jgi:hypothetical protein
MTDIAAALTIGEKQELFMLLLPRLIDFAHAQGYQLRAGELWRGDAQVAANVASGAGISNSLHPLKLAIDLNLFRHGVWLTRSEAHQPLGDFWKTLHPLCRWGGDFKRPDGSPKPDGNHYSVEHEGRK